jgi:CelD/BcsL family acetyltransferase involved in cellulose biosynthesis
VEVRQIPRPDRDAWNECLVRYPEATPFHGWAWNRAFAEVFRPHEAVYGLIEGSELTGIYPLRRNGGVLRPLAAGPSDYLAPLGEFPAEELSGLVLDASQTTAGGFLHATCLKISLPSSFEEYLKRLSKSLRTDIRRGFENPDLKIERSDDWEVFFHLHRQRWKQKRLPGAFLKKHERLHRRFAELSPGEAELLILRHQGTPIGAIYLMHSPTATFFYQSGMDPAASRYSPGTLLVAEAIRGSIEDGKRVFDFCRGDEPYKRRWKPDLIQENRRDFIPIHPSGHLLLPYLTSVHLFESAIKARVEGGWQLRPPKPA